VHGIPVFSLYGDVTRPKRGHEDSSNAAGMICRTSAAESIVLTTLRYVLEEGAKAPKRFWVRIGQNPIGRPVEVIDRCVPAAKVARRRNDDAPRPHARELDARVRGNAALDVDCQIVTMQRWRLTQRWLRGALGAGRGSIRSPNAQIYGWRAASGEVMLRRHEVVPREGAKPRDRWNCSGLRTSIAATVAEMRALDAGRWRGFGLRP